MVGRGWVCVRDKVVVVGIGDWYVKKWAMIDRYIVYCRFFQLAANHVYIRLINGTCIPKVHHPTRCLFPHTRVEH